MENKILKPNIIVPVNNKKIIDSFEKRNLTRSKLYELGIKESFGLMFSKNSIKVYIKNIPNNFPKEIEIDRFGKYKIVFIQEELLTDLVNGSYLDNCEDEILLQDSKRVKNTIKTYNGF